MEQDIAAQNIEKPGFGIYVHWPFCQSKCPYCDFNSHVREEIDEARWRAALLAELDHYAASIGEREVGSIFFGGGTPSLMAPETVAAVLERIGRHWRLAPEVEITLEANPSSAETGKLRGFREAGINRLSLGVQALDAEALRFLGRRHDLGEALRAIEAARMLFPRYSFDLIYARPGQSLESWRAELLQAIDLAGDHLSVYQLTVEKGTAFYGDRLRGAFTLPEEDAAAALHELTQELLGEAGLPAYEISNHARAGGESRHNLVYWRYGDYLGVGPGAHGRLTDAGSGWKYATAQLRKPDAWLAEVEASGHATEEYSRIESGARLEEMLMMGLRLAEPVPRGRFRRECGQEPEQLFDAGRLARLRAGGFLSLDQTGMRATEAGRQRLDALLRSLLA